MSGVVRVDKDVANHCFWAVLDGGLALAIEPGEAAMSPDIEIGHDGRFVRRLSVCERAGLVLGFALTPPLADVKQGGV